MRKLGLAVLAALFLVSTLPADASAGGKRRGGGKKAAVAKSGGKKAKRSGGRGPTSGALDADLQVQNPRAVLPYVPPPDLSGPVAPGGGKKKGGNDTKLGSFDTGKKGLPGTSVKHTVKIPGVGGPKSGGGGGKRRKG
jgi:hypothetical protein